MKRSSILLLPPTAALFVALCAGALCEQSPEQVCEPGRADDCPCVGAADGVQVCKDDGSGWGECDCGDDEVDAGPGGEVDAGPEGCDATPGDPGGPDCTTCINCAQAGPCAEQMAACTSNADCAAFGACAGECADQACQDLCAANYPAGRQLYVDAQICTLCDTCPVSCDGPSLGC